MPLKVQISGPDHPSYKIIHYSEGRYEFETQFSPSRIQTAFRSRLHRGGERPNLPRLAMPPSFRGAATASEQRRRVAAETMRRSRTWVLGLMFGVVSLLFFEEEAEIRSKRSRGRRRRHEEIWGRRMRPLPLDCAL